MSLLFGGASREHALRLALVELAAVPVLAWAGWRLAVTGAWRTLRLPLAVAAAVLAVPLLQLLPLPFELWRGLPGRAPVAEALELAAAPAGWLPLSLAPEQTWRAALALVPPLAMFLAVLALPEVDRRRLLWLYLAAAVVGVLLGAAQAAGGPDSPLYPYRTTNAGSPVGFFANRNHLAALLAASLAPAAVLLGEAVARAGPGRRTPALLAGAFFLIVLAGLAAVRSRAGVALAAPALLAGLALVWRARAGDARLGVGLAAGAALAFVAVLGLGPLLARFDAGLADRLQAWPRIAEAAATYAPLGAGIGAFDPVYRSVEPLEAMGLRYLNHAHNDYLELWLEAGWLAVGALALFGVWLARAARAAWRRRAEEGGRLALAVVASLLVLMLHSGVDYPLRTEALAVVFALMCGLAAGALRSR